MNKFTHLFQFVQSVFNEKETAEKAKPIKNLVSEGINFVIRLKVGPKFTDQEGKIVALTISKGEGRVIDQQGVLYGQNLCQLDWGLERRI